MRTLAALVALLCSAAALAEAPRDRFRSGGYFRIMARPDFQGGFSQLGYSRYYGRLLNEGPWGALELSLDVLQNAPGKADPWATVHTKLEGGSFHATDQGQGALSNFRITQLYVKAGNVLLEDVVWQLGTVDSYSGYLGLYDERISNIFFDTVGLSATVTRGKLEVMAAVGDAGFNIRGAGYNTIFTAGAMARYRISDRLNVGLGGKYRYEPAVSGNRNALYSLSGPGFATESAQERYEAYLRRQTMQGYFDRNPQTGAPYLRVEDYATPRSGDSFILVADVGFGGLGPLVWDNFYLRFARNHPERAVQETLAVGNASYSFTVPIADLTDQRYSLLLGNEAQFRLLPERLEAAWAQLFVYDVNQDNRIASGEDNRILLSTVLRLQYFLTETVHLLGETALAHERSLNGNLYRRRADSIFTSTRGRADNRGLEFGDSDIRNTFQLKTGVVLNPLGRGIYQRPSLRLLYGMQYSTQQAAFGHGFVDSLEQFNQLQAGPERHWHHLVAIEAEAWF